MKITATISDAALNAAFSYAQREGERIKAKVYELKYPEHDWRSLVPVDGEAGAWDDEVSTIIEDLKGEAAIVSGNNNDVPTVSIQRGKDTKSIYGMALGGAWGFAEINKAMERGGSLSDKFMRSIRRGHEVKSYKLAMFGDEATGEKGLLNQTIVAKAAAAKDWATASPEEILVMFNDEIIAGYKATNYVYMPDTVIVPMSKWLALANRIIPDTGGMTVMDYIINKNVYTEQTKKPLNIEPSLHAETAGAGSTSRMVTYRKNVECLAVFNPLPLLFTPIERDKLEFSIIGYQRMSGLDLRIPATMRYFDGI
ncbi:major capsid family protein [Pseudovibrio sp. POLY-S9]|uniref:major capsid family protein n=1 Tax=Pseudovibrio sp. POLY-S9 TaxID=1576596 RepID=UPI000708ADE0|nr:major capsid family protein [Pseudovibrio sp. POLY-S9]